MALQDGFKTMSIINGGGGHPITYQITIEWDKEVVSQKSPMVYSCSIITRENYSSGS